jgi:hypothetical protein
MAVVRDIRPHSLLAPALLATTYQVSNQGSANIANGDLPNGVCVCDFYAGADCTGAKFSAHYGDNKCASSWEHGFQSMMCSVSGCFQLQG